MNIVSEAIITANRRAREDTLSGLSFNGALRAELPFEIPGTVYLFKKQVCCPPNATIGSRLRARRLRVRRSLSHSQDRLLQLLRALTRFESAILRRRPLR